MGNNYDFVNELKIDDNLSIFVPNDNNSNSDKKTGDAVKNYIKDAFKGVEDNYYNNPKLSLYCCRKLLEASLRILAKKESIEDDVITDENGKPTPCTLYHLCTPSNYIGVDIQKKITNLFKKANSRFDVKTICYKYDGGKLKETKRIDNSDILKQFKDFGIFSQIRQLGNNDAHLTAKIEGKDVKIDDNDALNFISNIYPKLYSGLFGICRK